ncbi:MAG: hypothetical protein Q9187_008515 [Circinaria calcarea]
MSTCSTSWATSPISCHEIHSVRCALLLLWRLQWGDGTDEAEMVRLVEMAPQQAREVFKILLGRFVVHNGYAPPYPQLFHRCYLIRWEYAREDLSANERRFRKREALCIERRTKALLFQAVLKRGLNALEDWDSHTESEFHILPEDDLDQITLPWLETEFALTEEESQAEWDQHSYVKLGLLPRLM